MPSLCARFLPFTAAFLLSSSIVMAAGSDRVEHTSSDGTEELAQAENLAQSEQLAQSSKPFLFIGNENIAPMIYLQNGQVLGLAADIFKAIQDLHPGLVRFETDEWATAQERVRSGEGAGLVQLNRNPAREEYLLFSDTLLRSEFSIFKSIHRPDIVNLDSLEGRIVGVERAGYPSAILKKHPNIGTQYISNWEEGMRLVQAGRLDAVLVDRWVGEFVLAKSRIYEVVVLEEPVEVLDSHIAVRKEFPELLAKINEGLATIQSNGTRDRILDKWRGEQVVYVSRDSLLLTRLVYGLTAVLVVAALLLLWLNVQRMKSIKAMRAQAGRLDELVHERTRELALERDRATAAGRAKTEFLATMSHELRTPLNAVIGFAELLQDTVDPQKEADRVRDFSTRIGISGRALLRLINDLLDFAKIEDGQFTLVEEPFSLGREIKGTLETFDFKATEQNVRYTWQYEGKELFLSGDAVRLSQVINNLVDNAIKFSPGGTVSVLCTSEHASNHLVKVTVEVRDSGIGISDDKIETIFSPFIQSDSSITRRFGGTGLGLPISRSIARLMGGDLTVESHLDEGSTFTATFFIDDVTALRNALAGMKKRNTDRDDVEEALSLRVLTVDDVESNLDVADAILTELKCEVFKARNGQEAVDWVRDNEPDVVMMDIHMPVKDGIAAAREIHALPGRSETPIVAWTADVTSEEALNEADVNWAGALLKPITRSKLATTLRDAANRHHFR